MSTKMHPNFDASMTVKQRLQLIYGPMATVFKRRSEPNAPIFDLRDECIALLRSAGP